jgi:hypothetical protein
MAIEAVLPSTRAPVRSALLRGPLFQPHQLERRPLSAPCLQPGALKAVKFGARSPESVASAKGVSRKGGIRKWMYQVEKL